MQSVCALRDAIKEKKRPIFDDIQVAADSLSLRRLPFTTAKTSKEVEALNLVDGNRLPPLHILSDIFSDIERESVHIIIDRPHSGGCIS